MVLPAFGKVPEREEVPSGEIKKMKQAREDNERETS
jgi:hypothetical protein